jgi:glycerol-3-phosphate responsive antiterminator
LDWVPPHGLDAGLLLRDTDLMSLIHRASQPGPPLALDIDTVAGLGADEKAIEFVLERLGIDIVLTRRPHLADMVADRGGLGLFQVLAFDSTGMHRALEAHPRRLGVGSAVSPGLVLAHLVPIELAELPRPVLAYGLIESAEDAWSILDRAEAIVVRPETARHIAMDRRDSAASLDRRLAGAGTGSIAE